MQGKGEQSPKWAVGDFPILLYTDGDEWVCYQGMSGDTHLLELVPGTVLELLRERACTRDELIEQLLDRFEFEPGLDLGDYLDAILKKFELNALIRIVE